MSAYLVNEETIHRVLKAAFVFHINWPENIANATRTSSDFGQMLWNMNQEAVNYRYNENEKAPKYEYQRVEATNHQLYKSLQCFLYQCSEGDINQTQLYKHVEKIKDEVARQLIEYTKEYEEAEWG